MTYHVDSCGNRGEISEQCECGCNAAGTDCATCGCEPDCTDRRCGSDGCGGSCPPGCDAGETCNEATGQCIAELETVLWEYEAGDHVHSSVARGSDGKLYIISKDGMLHAVDPQGQPAWTRSIAAEPAGNYTPVPSPVVRSDDVVLAASWGSDCLIAYDAAGDEQWRYSTGLGLQAAPAIDPDDNAYFGCKTPSGGGYIQGLCSVDAQGQERWVVENVGWTLEVPPSLGPDGNLYIINDHCEVLSYDTAGNERWTVTLDLSGVDYPTCKAPIAIAGDGTLVVHADDHGLLLDPSDGSVLQSLAIEGSAERAPIWLGGAQPTAVFAKFGAFITAELIAVGMDGNVRWREMIGTGSTGICSPAADSDLLLYLPADTLYTYSADGTAGPEYEVGIRGPTRSSPLISQDGTIYLTGGTKLIAVESNSTGRAADAWPRRYRDERNTSCWNCQ